MDSALIAVIGALVGILLTNGIKLVLDARARTERVRDIQTALRAEIRSHRRALEVFLDDERAEQAIAGIANGPDVTPFVPREISPFVFEAVVGDIHILPGAVIDPIVLYYRQWQTLAATIEDMREPSFRELSQPRKAAVYRDYLAVGAYAVELAKDAVDAINLSLSHKGEA